MTTKIDVMDKYEINSRLKDVKSEIEFLMHQDNMSLTQTQWAAIRRLQAYIKELI